MFIRNDLRRKVNQRLNRTGRRNRGADIDHSLPNVGRLIPLFSSSFAVS